MGDDTTALLQAVRAGDRAAFDALFALAYDELRLAAHHRLRSNQAPATLNTTVLVHEAYLRLVDGTRAQWADRAHFLALASRAMRFVLIDHLRASHAQKRGGADQAVPLSRVELAADTADADELLTLNDALERLFSFSPRLGQLIEYKFFGGLTHEEIAEALDVSVPTVKRDWVRARAWLFENMRADATTEGET